MRFSHPALTFSRADVYLDPRVQLGGTFFPRNDDEIAIRDVEGVNGDNWETIEISAADLFRTAAPRAG